MEKYLVLDHIPDNFRIKKIGEGSSAACYLTSFNMAYKEYFSDAPNYHLLEKLSDIETLKFIFPKSFVFNGDIGQKFFVGYLSNYFNGRIIYELNKNILRDKIIEELILLEDDIIKLSDKRVMLQDMNYENILINDLGEIKVIDPDYYWFSSSFTNKKEILRLNYSGCSQYLVSSILDIRDDEITDRRLLSIKRGCNLGHIKASEFIMEVANHLEKESLPNNSIDDLQMGLKLIRRE